MMLTVVRGVGFLLFSASVGFASACSICTANVSYNFFPFTAAWVVVFIAWLSIVTVAYQAKNKHGNDIARIRSMLKAALKFLAVVLVLYLFGLHLALMLALPILLLVGLLRFKQTDRRLWWATAAALLLMPVAVPVSYAAFPKVASEPETRVIVHKTRTEMRNLQNIGIAGKVEQKSADPFAYTLFDVPVLNVIAQGFGTFYKRIPEPANQVRLVKSAREVVLWSRGPDGDFNLSEDDVIQSIDQQTSRTLIATMSYDATNGTLSRGDLIVTGLD